MDGIPAEHLDDLVEQAVAGRQHCIDEAHHNDGGNEMRHIDDGLYAFFEILAAHLVHEQCKDDRNGEAHHDGIHADAQRVLHQAYKIFRFEELDKVFEAYPFPSGDAEGGHEITKRDLSAVQRRIHENDIPDKRGQQQQIQIPAAPDLLARMAQSAVFIGAGGSRLSGGHGGFHKCVLLPK